MSKERFLRELELLLQDLTEEEREEILEYYRELFAEAAPEEEAEILRNLGSPETVAAELREGLRGATGTDFSEFRQVPGEYVRPRGRGQSGTREGSTASDRRRDALLLIVLFLVFGLPIAGTILSAGFSAAAGIAGCLLGVVGGLFGLVIGAFVTACAFLVAGVALVVTGIVNLASPAMGLMLMCLGFLALSAAMLLLILAKWGLTTAVPGVFRFSVWLLRRLCGWAADLIRRIFGRGGASA